jgi:endonuclease/exonuclease/phosphatase family metal-dependent hydrolase
MSFNIRDGTFNDHENRWENRRTILYDVLRKYGCDIVGLQEAYRFQIDQICEAVPQYGWIGVGRDDGKDKGEHSAILYRKGRFDMNEQGAFWFSDTPERPGSITWGNVVTRICTWGRFVDRQSHEAFYVFNLHLDHISQPSREKSAVLLERRIASRPHPDPVVVTGDFNSDEKNGVIQYMQGRLPLKDAQAVLGEAPIPLIDTFRQIHPDAKETGTFHEFKGGRNGEKIDYVFVLPGVKVLEAGIIHDAEHGRYPSDHFPIMAEISLPDEIDVTTGTSPCSDSVIPSANSGQALSAAKDLASG